MTSSSIKSVHSLILDANPILRNDPPISTLLAQAEQLYSIPAVVDEIRDAEARTRFETTFSPFLTLRTPKPASVKTITDFARRTGDLEVLSKPDVQILALAYELECERNHGDWRLRSMPGQKRTNGPPPASLTDKASQEGTDATITELPKTRTQSGLDAVIENAGSQHSEVISADDAIVDTEAQVQADGPNSSVSAISRPENLETIEQVTAKEPTEELQEVLAETSLELQPDAPNTMTAASEEDDDEEGWITPSNLQKHKEADNTSSSPAQEEPKTMQVATMTADYAMQNVLLRMNLNLISPNFQRIKQLKTWVLRCHACFDITKDMARQFCKKCGKPTLLRVACSTDKDGNFQVHLKKNMQWNNRGNVYSIPKPVAGSTNGKRSIGGGQGGWGQNLILAEDQKEYVNAMTSERRRKEKDLMDEDYLPNILSGDRRGPQGRPKVGAGRNVNSKKRH